MERTSVLRTHSQWVKGEIEKIISFPKNLDNSLKQHISEKEKTIIDKNTVLNNKLTSSLNLIDSII